MFILSLCLCSRTFSKTYGLAALRVGWCYTSQKIANIINKIKPPFNTTTISQSLAIKALEDKEHIENSYRNMRSFFIFYVVLSF